MSERTPEGGMFCPQCRVEYRPGFTRCSDCHVPLVEAGPMLVEELPRAIRSAGQTAVTLRWSGIPVVLWLTSIVAYLFVGADHATGQHLRLSPFVLLVPAGALV